VEAVLADRVVVESLELEPVVAQATAPIVRVKISAATGISHFRLSSSLMDTCTSVICLFSDIRALSLPDGA